jgi:hypothetical protein
MMHMGLRLAGAAGLALLVGVPQSMSGETPRQPDSYLYILWPSDGAVIKGNSFVVRFGLRGMGVTQAGSDAKNAGHHHLLIDVDPKTIDMNDVIPNDKNHRHYGAGQTEDRIELPPGKHTLQLVLGDKDHIPFNPPLLSKIHHITVMPAR